MYVGDVNDSDVISGGIGQGWPITDIRRKANKKNLIKNDNNIVGIYRFVITCNRWVIPIFINGLHH